MGPWTLTSLSYVPAQKKLYLDVPRPKYFISVESFISHKQETQCQNLFRRNMNISQAPFITDTCRSFSLVCFWQYRNCPSSYLDTLPSIFISCPSSQFRCYAISWFIIDLFYEGNEFSVELAISATEKKKKNWENSISKARWKTENEHISAFYVLLKLRKKFLCLTS